MKPDLTQSLRDQHHKIQAAFFAVGKSAHLNRETIVQFLRIESTLMEHIAFEDQELYGAFIAVTDRDPRVKKIVATFETEINLISEFAIGFFKKYTPLRNPDIDDEELIRTFPADFKLLEKSLRSRIDREEHVLFPIYDRMLEDDAQQRAA